MSRREIRRYLGFETFYAPGGGGHHDSEVQILANIARALEKNTNARDVVNLFTERPMCLSCDDATDAFRLRFPNITLNIIDGGLPLNN